MRRQYAIMQATQVNVSFSLTVEQRNEIGHILNVLPLISFSLTWLIMLVWNARLMVNRTRYELAVLERDIRYELAVLERDIRHILDITGKVLSIGFNSLVFALQ